MSGRFRRLAKRRERRLNRRHAPRLRFPLAIIGLTHKNSLTADVVYLSPGEELPDLDEDPRWLTIEASDDGRFFGTGGSFKGNGEWVGYGSLAAHDGSLEMALAAAQQWAEKYDAPTIWVPLSPSGSE